jgi:hypothetical protein
VKVRLEQFIGDSDSRRQRRGGAQIPVADYIIRIVAGDETRDTRMVCSFEHACEVVDKMQAEFDADREPSRVFVIDDTGVPVAAGGENPANRFSPQRRHSGGDTPRPYFTKPRT